MTTLPKQITLSYTLRVPITFQDFVSFINKDEERDIKLSVQDAVAEELWIAFVEMMKGKKKILPSGRPVDINQEPDHEVTHQLRDSITQFLQEEESDDEEDEADAQ